jgi:aryl-alcohol dehydrogenase-like predicted oxidoreductase
MQSAYRKLGRTGFDVSALGFGTWQLGGERWRPVPEDEALRLLRFSRDLGINIFDAAVVYGQYSDSNDSPQSRSQELLGKAFGPAADDVFICTKVGQYDEYSHRGNFTASRLVEQVRQSMRRLRTDVLDICLVHAPSLWEVRDGLAIEVLKTLQAVGWIRAIGYSFENDPHGVMASLEQPVDVIMLQYNLLDRECEDAIDRAAERGVGVLAGGPFKRGYLTGRYKSLEDIPVEDDYWRWNLRRNPRKVSAILQAVASVAEHTTGAADLRTQALRHVLRKPGVASAIVGHRTTEEVVENMEHVLTW